MEVQIDVVDRANNPPVWDHAVYGPIYIKENLPVGASVVSVKARSVTVHVLLVRQHVAARSVCARFTRSGVSTRPLTPDPLQFPFLVVLGV